MSGNSAGTKTCRTCRGSGRISRHGGETCDDCSGTGLEATRPYIGTLNPGSDQRASVKFRDLDGNVEFTDRYGGRHVSWLRACRGGCEAMGVVPHKPVWAVRGPRGWRPDPGKLAAAYGPIAAGEPSSKEEMHLDSEWIRLEKLHSAHDGYHFVACYFCGGSGRASWLRTIARVPRWIARGVKTFCQFAERTEVYGPNTTRAERWSLSFKVAFLADLGLWRP